MCIRDREYALVNVAGADGGFVGDVREACEKVLTDVADKCFDTEYLKAEQTVRIMDFIEKTYAVDPEFRWEKYPYCAVFRVSENRKWLSLRHILGKISMKEQKVIFNKIEG